MSPMNIRNYPKDWKAISLRIRKERAKDCCEDCGAPNGAWIQREKLNPREFECCLEDDEEDGMYRKPVRVVLTVAHIGAPKEDGTPGDKHDKHDVREENLRALCQRCHLVLDIKDHAVNRKYGRDHRKNQLRAEL